MNTQQKDTNSDKDYEIKMARVLERRTAKHKKYVEDLKTVVKDTLVNLCDATINEMKTLESQNIPEHHWSQSVSTASLQLTSLQSRTISESGIFDQGPLDAHSRDGDMVTSVLRSRVENAINDDTLRAALKNGSLEAKDVEASFTQGLDEEIEKWRSKSDVKMEEAIGTSRKLG